MNHQEEQETAMYYAKKRLKSDLERFIGEPMTESLRAEMKQSILYQLNQCFDIYYNCTGKRGVNNFDVNVVSYNKDGTLEINVNLTGATEQAEIMVDDIIYKEESWEE